MKKIYLILGAIALFACNQTAKNKPTQAEDVVVQVLLDTLLENITKQQNVKVLAELTEKQEDGVYTYTGGGYSFKIKIKKHTEIFPEDMQDENSVFFDGKTKIAFRDYPILCYQDTNYICNDFGFNSYHYFYDPKIIETGGKKFLYADLGFPCNGMGCGQKLTMIYDLMEKKPTFVGNFRIPFDKFLLSDFNNDNVPDLLVIAKSYNRTIKGTGNDFPEFNMKLLVYSYEKGTFMLNKNFFYDLYGMGDETLGYNEKLVVEKNNWFCTKKENKMWNNMEIVESQNYTILTIIKEYLLNDKGLEYERFHPRINAEFIKNLSPEIKTIIAFYTQSLPSWVWVENSDSIMANALGDFTALDSAQTTLLRGKEHYFKDIVLNPNQNSDFPAYLNIKFFKNTVSFEYKIQYDRTTVIDKFKIKGGKIIKLKPTDKEYIEVGNPFDNGECTHENKTLREVYGLFAEEYKYCLLPELPEKKMEYEKKDEDMHRKRVVKYEYKNAKHLLITINNYDYYLPYPAADYYEYKNVGTVKIEIIESGKQTKSVFKKSK